MKESSGTPNGILVEQGLIHADGGMNPLMVNAASGTLTVALVDALWANHPDMDVMDDLESYLNELYESSQYAAMMCAIKALYLSNGIPFADVLESILQAGDEKLLEAYLYEFLADFEDAKFGLADEEEAEE